MAVGLASKGLSIFEALRHSVGHARPVSDGDADAGKDNGQLVSAN